MVIQWWSIMICGSGMPGRIGSSRGCRRRPWWLAVSLSVTGAEGGIENEKSLGLRNLKRLRQNHRRICHPGYPRVISWLCSALDVFFLKALYSMELGLAGITYFDAIFEMRSQSVRTLYMYPNDGFDSMLKYHWCCRLSLFWIFQGISLTKNRGFLGNEQLHDLYVSLNPSSESNSYQRVA